MTLTRANTETILVKRLSPLLAAAGMAVTYAGANADLNDPIGWGIRQAGGTVATYTSVADADVATVADADLDQMLDLGEYRVLSSILGNLDDTNVTSGPYKEELAKLAEQAERRLDKVEAQLRRLYGWPRKQAAFGTITLSFAEHDDDSAE